MGMTKCTDFFFERFSGHSRSGWNPLRSCRNYSCYNEPARQILLQPTISLRWVYIERYIFPTGFTDFSSRAFSMRFQFLLESSRPSSIRTFSTSITRSKSSNDSNYLALWARCGQVLILQQGDERKEVCSSCLKPLTNPMPLDYLFYYDYTIMSIMNQSFLVVDLRAVHPMSGQWWEIEMSWAKQWMVKQIWRFSFRVQQKYRFTPPVAISLLANSEMRNPYFSIRESLFALVAPYVHIWVLFSICNLAMNEICRYNYMYACSSSPFNWF